jgi:hypothetical protein
MQATFNFAQNNAERGGSHDDVNHRMAQLFKLFGLRTATLLPAILICLLMLMGRGTFVAQTMSHPTNAAASSDAQKAFEKMKTLAGSWQGTIMDIPINFTIRAASSGTAILHEATGDGTRPQTMRSLCSTWKGIVCSRPIIVTLEIGLALKGRCRRMERRASSIFSMLPEARREDW